MARVGDGPSVSDTRALVAVDLGAESCRVSLLRWNKNEPHVSLIHRFANEARESDAGLRWDMERIEAEVDAGLRKCATLATEGIRSVAVDGWAVDYVCLDATGQRLSDPFCYRDPRTIDAVGSLEKQISADRLRALTGVQRLRINTLYQLHADVLADAPAPRWQNIPEYLLSRLGGRCVAEETNASHTQLLDLHTHRWCPEIFAAAGLSLRSAPMLVAAGTDLGQLQGPLAAGLAPFRNTRLIAPACHDTASAIAGIPASGNDWAYISSGTWSLVGTVLERPLNDEAASVDNFTNLRAVGGRICFHKNVNGMWLLRQCMAEWSRQGRHWSIAELIAAATRLTGPPLLLDVDEADLLMPQTMPARMNAQIERRGGESLDLSPDNAPAFANLIFHSLAARYAEVLARISYLTGKPLRRLFIVGGGAQNGLLNHLTEQATGLHVVPGSPESSTLGNFAIQLAALEQRDGKQNGVSAERVERWAAILSAAMTPSL